MLVYFGPTMGKTYASMSNPKLVDFDDLIREDMLQYAEMLNMTIKEFKKSNNFWYKKIIKEYLIKASKMTDKIVMVSNIGALDYPNFFNCMYIPSRDVFIKRNMERGGSLKESEEWYDSILNKRPELIIENRFINEILE